MSLTPQPGQTDPPALAGRSEAPSHHRRSGGAGLSAHILPTSATMIGVCLTALYISLLGPAGPQRVLVDKLMAGDAVVFLVSAALSFLDMRRPAQRLEWLAEAIFLGGLALLAAVALVMAFVIN